MLYLIIALLVPVLIFAGFYNSFAVRRNNVENAFAAIDTQLDNVRKIAHILKAAT